jgi:AcrR family transcriptional regulator
MDEIAAEAGITKPILYSHFGDKAGLVHALAGRVAAQVDAAVTTALQGSGEPRQVVESTLAAFCTFIEREPELYRFLVQSATSGSDRAGPRLMTDLSSQIAATLGSALRRSGADSGAAEPWAFAIAGMTFAAAGWWLERRSISKDELVRYLADLLWSGLSGAGLGSGDPVGRPHIVVVPHTPRASGA